tara:strand:- start:1385 stop:2662 length:1278 start_codon:yes stop_codon:yes gene_type:complete
MKRFIIALLSLAMTMSSYAYTGKEGSLERTVHNSTLLINTLNISIAKAAVTNIEEVCDSTITNSFGEEVYNVCLVNGSGIDYAQSTDGYTYDIYLSNELKSGFTVIPSTGSNFSVSSYGDSKFSLSCDSSPCNISFQVYGELTESYESTIKDSLNIEMTGLEHLINRRAKAVTSSQISWAKNTFIEASAASTQSYVDDFLAVLDGKILGIDLKLNEYKNSVNKSVEDGAKELSSKIDAYNIQTSNFNKVKVEEFNNAINAKAKEVSTDLIAANKQAVDESFDESVVEVIEALKVPPSNCGRNSRAINWTGEKWECFAESLSMGRIDMKTGRIIYGNSFFQNIKSVSLVKDRYGNDQQGHVRVDFRVSLPTNIKFYAGAEATYNEKISNDLKCSIGRSSTTYVELILYKGGRRTSEGFCSFHVKRL